MTDRLPHSRQKPNCLSRVEPMQGHSQRWGGEGWGVGVTPQNIELQLASRDSVGKIKPPDQPIEACLWFLRRVDLISGEVSNTCCEGIVSGCRCRAKIKSSDAIISSTRKNNMAAP